MTILRITAKRDGFRRAGIAHHGTVDHPAERFTLEQIAALKSEPMLIVQELEGEPTAEEAAGKGNKKAKAAGDAAAG